jgi:hypothetical protein
MTMNNPLIGELANKLLNMEDRGQQNTAAYAQTKTQYEALKALPESWADVRAAKRTPGQRILAEAFAAEQAALIAAGCTDGRVPG